MNTENVIEMLKELNKKHIFLYRNGKSEIISLRENTDGFKEVSFSNKSDFELYYSNCQLWHEGKKDSLGKIWIQWPGRNTKYKVDFVPGDMKDEDTFNLWQGFGIKPKEGSCKLYLDHIYNIIASGDPVLYEYILDYMADAVQNPGKKPGVALVLQSDQGAGKGIFVEYFSKLFGAHAAYVTNAEQIFGRFNAILSNKLLVFLDEGLWSGDRQKHGNLKALITSDKITIERKGFDPIEERNFVRLIVASNNEWVFPIERKERRGCVLAVSGDRIGDRAYFKAIAEEMDNGGTEALLDFLMKRDIADVEIRDYPRTTAFDDQMLNSFDAFDSWWHGCLSSGILAEADYDGTHAHTDWTSPISARSLFEGFASAAKGRNIKHHLSQEQFGKRLKKYVPNLQVNRLGKTDNRVKWDN
jgi:hypothetical protein